MNNQIFENLKEKKIFIVFKVALVILLVFLIAWVGVDILNKIREGKYIESKNTITVSATGEVYAKPDLALTVFSVITEAKTVVKALSDNTKKMNEVINSMKSQGIEEKDLKTTSFNIYPRYEWYDEKVFPPSGKRVLVGYEVQQSLQVKIRDMAKIGEVIEGGSSAGANEVGDLQLTIDNQDELKKQARGKAIEEAKAKAKELASQLGVGLVKIISFSENAIVPFYYGLEKTAATGMGGGEVPQIETGENKIEVTVAITYEIN